MTLQSIAPFDPTNNGSSLRNALFLASASSAAYAEKEDFSAAVTQLGLMPYPAIRIVDDISYFVGVGANFAVLAFRGTMVKDVHNWLTDATIEQVLDKFGKGKVHKGFFSALADMWDDVLASVKQPEVVGKPLFVTGHSLGGALATLAAQWLAFSGVDVRGTYTFGSPRVGNVDFYRNYQPIHFRFVNNCDIVPHVPLEVGALGLQILLYKHVGTLHYLDRHGHLNAGMSDWQAKKQFMINELTSTFARWDACIMDHAIDRYITAIARNVSE